MSELRPWNELTLLVGFFRKILQCYSDCKRQAITLKVLNSEGQEGSTVDVCFGKGFQIITSEKGWASLLDPTDAPFSYPKFSSPGFWGL
jgi:hypothetical protein